MASDGGRRMVFDIRGRRKHVVRVVYAVLALLMGASLFLVVGPVNIGALLGTTSGTSSAATANEEQATSIERRLKKTPDDEGLLAALVRARVNAGNSHVQIDPTTQQQKVTPEALAQYAQAGNAWERYLKQAGNKATAYTAQLAANAFFSTAQYSALTPQTTADLRAAAQAQKIVAEARPSLGSLSTLAIYQYFSLDFAAGDRTAKQVKAQAKSKSELKSAEKQLSTYRRQAMKFQKVEKQVAKSEKGAGKEKLENPLGGLAGGGSTATSTSPVP